MLRKLQYICLVGTIGLIGADRIDLFLGHGAFVLTPFLVLAPMALLIGFIRTGPRGLFRFTVSPPVRRQFVYVVAAVVFLMLAFISIPLGLDPERGMVLFADLLLIAVLGYCISVQILAEPDQAKLILRSVSFGLAIHLFFCVGECVAWSRGISLAGTPSSWLESMFAPVAFGVWIPRLSGPTLDASRAGFVLTMYCALLDRFVDKTRYTRNLRFILVFLIFLTLSVSAILCWFAYYSFASSFWARLKSWRILIRIAVWSIVISFVCVVYQRELLGLAEALEILDAISARTSVGKGSSGESHLLLIERGFKTWLSSPQTFVTGIGLGSAPKVLGDFFEDSKYGNFHCLYVTVLAELGFPAFCVLLTLLGYPIIGRSGTTSCLAAILVFNVGYQSHMEPVFWVVLPLLWSYRCKHRREVRTTALYGATPQPG